MELLFTRRASFMTYVLQCRVHSTVVLVGHPNPFANCTKGDAYFAERMLRVKECPFSDENNDGRVWRED